MVDYVGQDHLDYMIGDTIPAITMHAGMIASASNNYMWISCPNISAARSCWSSFVVRPDGIITGKLQPHTTEFLLMTIDTSEEYYDSTVLWRQRAIDGIYHSGELVDNERSLSRTSL